MRRRIRLAAAGTAAVVLLAATGCGIIRDVAAEDGAKTDESGLIDAIEALPVAKEKRDGYDRDAFPHWIDADDDGCNTRFEVLIAEATTAPEVGSRCRLSGGKWKSYYDGEQWTKPGDLDVDHLVPLAEVWDSGAGKWSRDDRQRYANDLDEERGLVAVTDNVNQSKGDADPAEWLPPRESAWCRYVEEWTAVKSRWGLSVDDAERERLLELAADCGEVTVEFAKAR